jgi:6-methylsalicylate decarboxylase
VVIDVHSHFHPEAFRPVVERLVGRPWPKGWDAFPHTDTEDAIKGRLDYMDAAGVDMQILSVGTHGPFSTNEVEAVEAAKFLNDSYAELIARHPTRFGGFAALPLPHIDASLREMRRCLDELSLTGVNLTCFINDRSLAEVEFEPLYEEMNRRGAVVCYHPIGNALCSPFIREYKLDGSAGNALEDGILVLHLITRQIAVRYPNVKYIVPHLGGFLPMLLGRLDHILTRQHGNLPELPTVTARKLFYDTVGHASGPALFCAAQVYGATQLVPGSDYPVSLQYEPYKDNFEYIKHAGLSEEDADRILNRNAPALLGL